MGYIKNYSSLATSDERKIVLDLIEAAIDSIQPEKVLKKNFVTGSDTIKIQNQTINIGDFQRIFLLGFGKGSAKIAKIIENSLGNNLYQGYDIDVQPESFSKIEFTQGTHPLPSQANLDFTQKVIEKLKNLTPKDLVFVITCGGGSVLFEKPRRLSLDQITNVNKILLKSGANISQMNVIRKHLSVVKGGGLAKILFPAKIFNLIFSDVPGNDLSTIASGPLVKDTSTIADAMQVLERYDIDSKTNLTRQDFVETPKENKFFKDVTNLLMVSNLTALEAMQAKAKKLGFKALIFSDKFQSEAATAAKNLIENTKPQSVLLAGGETTVNVQGKGQGGRNLEVALGAINYIDNKTILASFDSDGWDNCYAAGAIISAQTNIKAAEKNLDPQKYLKENNTLPFFETLGDVILTGRLPSNVADLIIIYKK